MVEWIDPQDEVLSTVTALAKELADPLRLTTLQLLATEGPHTMAQLAGALGVSAPRLGNHLARLRASGLVLVEHTGRHAVYRVARPGLGDVLSALSRYALEGAELSLANRPVAPDDVARTCYDHAAGLLGTAVFEMLVDRGAVRAPDGRGSELELGTDLSSFAELGVAETDLAVARRKVATACLDKTRRLPHLGGVAGHAVLAAFLRDGLVRREDDSRVLTVTDAGARRLPDILPGFRTIAPTTAAR